MKGNNTGMDGKYSWKRTEDAEIDLTDLLQGLCRQWKKAAVCALAAAVILGGYGLLRNRNVSDAAVSGMAEEAELTDAEEQGVTAAVQLQNEIRGLEAYLDSSVLMKIDPYHKNKCIMLYRLDHAERKELPVITECYLNFVQNGGAADMLVKSASRWKMDKSCLSELISAYQKAYSFPDQIVVDGQSEDGGTVQYLFYVETSGENARAAEKLAQDLQGVLKEYSAEVKKKAGSHKLALVSFSESVTSDSGLQSQQHDKKALLTSSQTNLKAMTDAFSRKQKAVYQELVGAEDEDEKEEAEEEPQEAVLGENLRTVIKYTAAGLAGGVFVYCCTFACCYILSDTVKSADEMKRLYTFPVYGEILLNAGNEKNRKSVPGMRQDAYGCTKAQTLNRIRLACQKQGMTRLCAASDSPLDPLEKECLESIAFQLRDRGIDLVVAENVSADTAVWNNLTETGNVLMVCRTGTTTHRMIDDAMNFYLENGITVAGAVAFLQNR